MLWIFPEGYTGGHPKGLTCMNLGTVSLSPDELSDWATAHRPMLFVHSRIVGHPVGRSVVLIETAPGVYIGI